MRAGRRWIGAFTLIELLVVIAIIAVLLALLVPSLTVVKDLGRRSICQANLRHMGMGVSGYSSSNYEIVPPVKYLLRPLSGGGGSWLAWWWADFMAPYFDADARASTTIGDTASVGYQPNDGDYDGYFMKRWGLDVRCSRRMDCPAVKNPNEYEYGWNFAYWNVPWAWARQDNASTPGAGIGSDVWLNVTPVRRVMDFKSPGSFIDIFDCASGVSPYYMDRFTNLAAYYGMVPVAGLAPHLKTFNALHMDGHVEVYDARTLANVAAKQKSDSKPVGYPWDIP